jgi:hypothetical protein
VLGNIPDEKPEVALVHKQAFAAACAQRPTGHEESRLKIAF